MKDQIVTHLVRVENLYRQRLRSTRGPKSLAHFAPKTAFRAPGELETYLSRRQRPVVERREVAD